MWFGEGGDVYLMCTIVSTLSLDIERFISDATTVMKTISTNKDQTKAIYIKLDQIKLVLSFLLTPGLNEDIDDICWTELKIPSSSSSVGFSRYDDYEAKTSGTHVAQALILRHFMAVKMVVMHGVFRVMSPQPAWWALPLSCALLACLKVRKL